MFTRSYSFHARLLFATLTFILATAWGGAVHAQSYLSGGGDANSLGGFSATDFGVKLDSFAAPKTEPLTVQGAVAPIPTETPDFWRVDGKTLVGFLSLQTIVAADSHIYSPTQGAGGLPTKFVDVNVSGAPDGSTLTVGEFRLASAIEIAKYAEGQTLEELFGTVEWLAPIYAEGDAATVDLSEVGKHIGDRVEDGRNHVERQVVGGKVDFLLVKRTIFHSIFTVAFANIRKNLAFFNKKMYI